MFFDTNVIIKFLDQKCEDYIVKLVIENALDKKAFVSGIVFAELLAYQGYTDLQARDIEFFLKENFVIYDVSEKILLLAAKIARDKKQKTGKKLKLTDAIIAATSILNNKKLFTFDKEDFSGLDNLNLYSYK